MKYYLFVLLLCVGYPVLAQPADTLQQVDQLFASWNNATPGVSVAVERNGRLLYNKAFGLADLEHNVPNTTETIFECGSISKQFTAAAILLLAKEGKLALSDDVRKYVPELPQYDAPITIQHLLNHSSGLKDWGVIYSLTGWPRSTRAYTQALSFDIVFRQRSLNFTPGSRYAYSNSNYVMLTLIVERLSGQSLAEFTSSRFFSPLGMTHTRWRDNFRDIIPNRAMAYEKSNGSYLQNMPFENVYGPGGLLTTTHDLLRWNKLLITHEILGEPMSTVRIKKGVLNNGGEISYAAGLTNNTANGFKEISHSGATAGYRAWLAYYPEKEMAVVLLSNDGSINAPGIGRSIAGIFLGRVPRDIPTKKEPAAYITLPESELKKWTGTYFNEDLRDAFTVEVNSQQLLVGGRPVKAVHSDTLYLDGLRWARSSTNTITLQSPSGTNTYTKVKPPRTNFSELNGAYHSDEAGVTYRLEVRETTIRVDRKPGDTYILNALFEDAFQDEDHNVYRFTRDKRGKITGFEVSLPRASRVPFTRVASAK